jgi:hypothetical protein
VDCGEYFSWENAQKHSTCISEQEKHEGSLHKRKAPAPAKEPEAKRPKEEKEEKKDKKEKKASTITVEALSDEIVKMLASKPMTLRKLKKKLIKDHGADDEQILASIFAVARKIVLSANEGDDDE